MLWFELSGFGVVGDWRASSLGHAMGLAMVAWPMSPSLPPCGWIASSQLLLPEWLHRGAEHREHGPDPEMSPVPAAATRHPCTCSWWPVCAAARTILPHFPCPGLSSRLRLSQGWIRSAARQSVGGERRSRLGNTKQ